MKSLFKKIKDSLYYLRVIPSIIQEINSKQFKRVFVFPRYSNFGGGELVHFQIANLFNDQMSLLIFEEESQNEFYKQNLSKLGILINLPKLNTSSIVFNYIFKKIAAQINRKKDIIVFGSSCLNFYKIIPLLNKDIKVIDLIHSFEPGSWQEVSIPFANRIDQRVILGTYHKKQFVQLYQDKGIDPNLNDRVVIIPNKVECPKEFCIKENTKTLDIIFVGRGTYEKRVELFVGIARKCFNGDLDITFTAIGDIDKSRYDVPPNLQMIGKINDKNELNTWYKKANIILLTSSTEGLPMVLLEAMSHSVVPIATSVGDISDLLLNNAQKCGFLIENSKDEKQLVNDFYEKTLLFYNDRELLKKMSFDCYQQVKNNFNSELFAQRYLDLFK